MLGLTKVWPKPLNYQALALDLAFPTVTHDPQADFSNSSPRSAGSSGQMPDRAATRLTLHATPPTTLTCPHRRHHPHHHHHHHNPALWLSFLLCRLTQPHWVMCDRRHCRWCHQSPHHIINILCIYNLAFLAAATFNLFTHLHLNPFHKGRGY